MKCGLMSQRDSSGPPSGVVTRRPSPGLFAASVAEEKGRPRIDSKPSASVELLFFVSLNLCAQRFLRLRELSDEKKIHSVDVSALLTPQKRCGGAPVINNSN